MIVGRKLEHYITPFQYSDSGWFTCAGYPGSFQNELRDATNFQDWGFDYLKCDPKFSNFLFRLTSSSNVDSTTATVSASLPIWEMHGVCSFWVYSPFRRYYPWRNGRQCVLLYSSCSCAKFLISSSLEYTRMADALAQLASSSGQAPFLFSLCQWGWVREVLSASIFWVLTSE